MLTPYQVLLKEQPVAARFLKSVCEQNKLPQALLLVTHGADAESVVRFVAQKVLCPAKTACGTCASCKQVANNKMADYYVIDGNENQYRAQLVAWQEQINQTSLTKSNNKVFFIKNIGAIRGETSGALLKILEEPPQNTYFIATATNQRQVLPTIRSRCCLIYLHPVQKKFLVGELTKQRVPQEDARILAQLANSVKKVLEIFNNNFNENKGAVTQFFSFWLKNKVQAKLFLLKTCLNHDEIRSFLVMFRLFLQDILRYGVSLPVAFEAQAELLQELCNKNFPAEHVWEKTNGFLKGFSKNLNVKLQVTSWIVKTFPN